MHQAEQLKDLEKESDRLKRLFADAEPDQSILRLEWVVVKTLSMEPGSPRETPIDLQSSAVPNSIGRAGAARQSNGPPRWP